MKLTYTPEIREAITKEADALKSHLTTAEKTNLDHKTFDPTVSHGCVYGQVTGGCHSTRAKHLLQKCAVPYSHKIDEYVPAEENSHFEDRKLFKMGIDDTYSHLEFAMFNDAELREEVISYLKSEVPSLDFNHLTEKV